MLFYLGTEAGDLASGYEGEGAQIYMVLIGFTGDNLSTEFFIEIHL